MDFFELPASEQDVLQQIYGRQMSDAKGIGRFQIEDALELTEDEARFFDHKNFVSPYFSQQTLYKVQGKLLPLRMNLAIRQMVEKTDFLRSNYCQVGTRVLRIVFQMREELPVPVYRNLTQSDPEELDGILKKAMDADMRETFDLVHGNLVRFSVYRTGETECALLVTAIKFVAAHLDIAGLLRTALSEKAAEYAAGPVAAVDPILSTGIMTESVRNYWTKVLTDFPDVPELPFERKMQKGRYQQKSARIRISLDTMSELRREARLNRTMLMSILETAWGLLLQQLNPDLEISLCMLVPGRKAANQTIAPSGTFHVIPTRLGREEGISVRQLVSAQFQQLVVSRPYACFDWSGLRELAEGKSIRFNHFLSFMDFLEDGESYLASEALAEGKIVSRMAWDAQGANLGVYFRYDEDVVSVTFLYDERKFVPYGISMLAKRYAAILQYMLTNWEMPVTAFLEWFTKRLQLEYRDMKSHQEEIRVKARDFLAQLDYLQGSSTGTLQQLMQVCHILERYEGDRISGADIENQAIFVAEGRLVRSMDAGDGWYNVLDIVKRNSWLNETVLLPNRKTKISVEVLTERAVLIAIPMTSFYSLLRENSEIKDRILQHVLGEMEKYQRRWVQS